MRIAILSATGIGDLISLVPLVRKLGSLYPGASIEILTRSAGPLAGTRLVGIDAVRVYSARTIGKILLLERFDLMCAWGIQAKLFGIYDRLAYWTLISLFPASRKLVYCRGDLDAIRDKDVVAIKLDLVEKLGETPSPEDYRLGLPFEISGDGTALPRRAFDSDNGYVVLHIGAKAGHTSRRWPTERWVQVIHRLVDADRVAAVLVGGSDELAEAHDVVERAGCPVVDLVGRLDIPETAAVIQHARLVIATNSGPMWIAAALGRPQIILSGPSRHEWTPRHAKALILRRAIAREHCDPPCDRAVCAYGDNRCMLEIRAEDVVDAIACLDW